MEDVIKNNRLIADFMGIPKMPRLRFKYHKDWNVFMPVVEKIEGLGEIAVQINNKRCGIYATHAPMIQTHGDSKIEAVYKAVIQFINHYNKQSN